MLSPRAPDQLLAPRGFHGALDTLESQVAAVPPDHRSSSIGPLPPSAALCRDTLRHDLLSLSDSSTGLTQNASQPTISPLALTAPVPCLLRMRARRWPVASLLVSSPPWSSSF